jgi:hypothetical protein
MASRGRAVAFGRAGKREAGGALDSVLGSLDATGMRLTDGSVTAFDSAAGALDTEATAGAGAGSAGKLSARAALARLKPAATASPKAKFDFMPLILFSRTRQPRPARTLRGSQAKTSSATIFSRICGENHCRRHERSKEQLMLNNSCLFQYVA